MIHEPVSYAPYLVAWGIQPSRGMSFAEDVSCPHCLQFSYFCRGDFSVHAATLWRQCVVGFSPASFGRQVGEAVLHCQVCGALFSLLLSPSTAVAYAEDCLFWPKPSYPRFVNTFLCHEMSDEVANSIAFLRHKWRCAIADFFRLWRQDPLL